MASGADRHLDIGLQVVEGHLLFPYFLEKRLAIPTSPFSFTSNGFSVTGLPPFFKLLLNYILALAQCLHNATQNLLSFP